MINKELIEHKGKRRLCVAPMLDWTDRHYRYLARQITRNAWLYSEMVNAGAIVYGDKDRFLMFNEGEQPVALQLGGSDP
ncbi:tRNA-dihydrouridine synthase, partial [Neisseria gonorrhoeae]